MPITDDTPGSPGWWMQRLSNKLQRELLRMRLLDDYMSGRPPLPWSTQEVKKQFYRFQKMSRTNFAEVIVEAPAKRIGLRSVTTGANQDATGDATAWQLVTANDLEVQLGVAVRFAKAFGRAYLATAMPGPEDNGYAVITAEDPRQVIHEAHPLRPNIPRAALKLYYDPEAERDVAILWLPGHKYVATHPRSGPQKALRSNYTLGRPEPVPVRFALSSFDLQPIRPAVGADPDAFYSEEYDDQEIPVDVFDNPGGTGEFENHIDLLDRINHTILQRVVITTLQAFRQRALKQDPQAPNLPDEDEQGNVIDYSSVFESGPDAMWILPPGAEMWESAQADIQGILAAVKDDVLHLSAVTFTPMSMFTPDAQQGSAEGAQLTREGLVFKVEDFHKVASRVISRSLARGFRYMGDKTRGDAAQYAVQWAPADRPSLAEMGSAAAQAGNTLTWQQVQEIIWQRTPQQIMEAKAQRAQDMVLQAQQASLMAAMAPKQLGSGPAPAGGSGGGGADVPAAG